MGERFTIDPFEWVETGKIRVRDNGELLPGKFHNVAQAIEWINLKLDKLAKSSPSQTGMRGRARAYLLESSDYYGENEARIKRIGIQPHE